MGKETAIFIYKTYNKVVSLAQLFHLSTISRLLGVTVHNHMSFVVRSCNYHIRHIDRETAANPACSIVASRLSYCNSVLYGISYTNIAKLQRMQNNLARVVCKSPYNTIVIKLLGELH